ncbi:hypothetical protein LENED_008558 [Lentinula edodes]|uniref:Uncharacterized protein n=1 Tax=Lentinula edodes TaxID=5353 RepID=A0A1Q3EHF6_LENED|nr:hypothetical protein LENED_008558 [Lentinula edodes]
MISAYHTLTKLPRHAVISAQYGGQFQYLTVQGLFMTCTTSFITLVIELFFSNDSDLGNHAHKLLDVVPNLLNPPYLLNHFPEPLRTLPTPQTSSRLGQPPLILVPLNATEPTTGWNPAHAPIIPVLMYLETPLSARFVLCLFVNFPIRI